MIILHICVKIRNGKKKFFICRRNSPFSLNIKRNYIFRKELMEKQLAKIYKYARTGGQYYVPMNYQQYQNYLNYIAQQQYAQQQYIPQQYIQPGQQIGMESEEKTKGGLEKFSPTMLGGYLFNTMTSTPEALNIPTPQVRTPVLPLQKQVFQIYKNTFQKIPFDTNLPLFRQWEDALDARDYQKAGWLKEEIKKGLTRGKAPSKILEQFDNATNRIENLRKILPGKPGEIRRITTLTEEIEKLQTIQNPNSPSQINKLIEQLKYEQKYNQLNTSARQFFAQKNWKRIELDKELNSIRQGLEQERRKLIQSLDNKQHNTQQKIRNLFKKYKNTGEIPNTTRLYGNQKKLLNKIIEYDKQQQEYIKKLSTREQVLSPASKPEPTLKSAPQQSASKWQRFTEKLKGTKNAPVKGYQARVGESAKAFANAFRVGGPKQITKEVIKRGLGLVMVAAGPIFAFMMAKDMKSIVRGANELLGNPWNDMTESYIIATATALVPTMAAAKRDVGGAIGGLAGELYSVGQEAIETYLDPKGDVYKAQQAKKQAEEMEKTRKNIEPRLQEYRNEINQLVQEIESSPTPQNMTQQIQKWINNVMAIQRIYANNNFPGKHPGYVQLEQARKAGYSSPWHVPSKQKELALKKQQANVQQEKQSNTEAIKPVKFSNKKNKFKPIY